MQTMKIIDLYSNIANGKEAPKLIKYKNIIYEFRKDINDYTSDNYFLSEIFNAIGDLKIALNTEVEIIEDKPTKIDKIIIEYDNKDEQCKLAYMNNCYELNPQEVIMLDKIEELRTAVNYLLEKSNSDE